MDKVALSWADLKIHTAEQAKQLSTVHNPVSYTHLDVYKRQLLL